MTIKKTNLDKFDPQCYRCIMPKKSTISKLEKVAKEEPQTQLAVNPNRQAEIIAEADRQGLTLPHLIKTIYDATNATRITYDKLGNVIGEEPDTAARIKASTIGFELRGEINTKVNIGTQNNVVAVIEGLNDKAKERLDEWKRTHVKDV